MFHLIIHTALLILAAFVIGCILGCLVRRLACQHCRRHAGTAGGKASGPVVPQAAVLDVPQTSVSQPVHDETAAAAALAALPADASNEDKANAVGVRPVGLAAPRGGARDDLKRIKGIGRVNEDKLNGLGIFHFDQIAAWTASEAAWVNTFLAFPGRIQREDWIGQAGILASGGVTEFAGRVDRGEVETSKKNPDKS